VKTAAEEENYRGVTITAGKHLQLQFCLSDAEIQATPIHIADVDRIVTQPKSEIDGITSIAEMRFTKKISFCLVKFEARCQNITIDEFQKTIEHREIQFAYLKMHHVSDVSESIRLIGSTDN